MFSRKSECDIVTSFGHFYAETDILKQNLSSFSDCDGDRVEYGVCLFECCKFIFNLKIESFYKRTEKCLIGIFSSLSKR